MTQEQRLVLKSKTIKSAYKLNETPLPRITIKNRFLRLSKNFRDNQSLSKKLSCDKTNRIASLKGMINKRRDCVKHRWQKIL